MESAQINTIGEATSDGPPAPKKKRERKQYPKPDRAVRVRIYPTYEQVRTLRAKVSARATVRNWVVDVFERSHARHIGDDDRCAGLTIECTKSAVSKELLRVRGEPSYAWLRCLSVWSCQHIVKQMFKARESAFEGKGRHPRRRAVRPNAPGSWSTYYDGRISDRHYRPERTKGTNGRAQGQCFHLSATGPLRVRTGKGHLPKQIDRFPTVTVRVDACGRWTGSFGVVSNGGAERWALEQAGAPVPAPGEGRESLTRDQIAGLDFGMTQLVTTDTGIRWPAARVLREEERKRRLATNERRGRARARRCGARLDEGMRRKARRKAKQAWTRHTYAEGGAIALKRKATKTEKLRKHNERVKHAREARKTKLEALEEQKRQEAEQGSETGPGTPEKNGGGRNPKVKCRKKSAAGNARRRRRRGRCDATTKRTRKLARKLSRANTKSARREHARLALAKHHAWIADHRANAIHQLTWWLVNAFKALAWEDIRVKDLLETFTTKALHDAAIAECKRQLAYKTLWRDMPAVQCPSDYPSSQLCWTCGWQFTELKLSQKHWTCKRCETRHHRDENAAANVAEYGISTWRSQGKTIHPKRTHGLGGTAVTPARAKTRVRPGSAQKVGTTRWRVRTTSGTSNREQATSKAYGTPRA